MYFEVQGRVKVHSKMGLLYIFLQGEERARNCEKGIDEMDGGARKEMKHSCVLEDKRLQGGGRREGQMVEKLLCFYLQGGWTGMVNGKMKGGFERWAKG